MCDDLFYSMKTLFTSGRLTPCRTRTYRWGGLVHTDRKLSLGVNWPYITPAISYRPQRSCGKVMFLHLFVILFTGVGGLCPEESLTRSLCPGPPGGLCQGDHPPPPPPPTPYGYVRAVRILLECILGFSITITWTIAIFSCWVRVRLYLIESSIASGCAHGKSNLMFIFTGDKDQRKEGFRWM